VDYPALLNLLNNNPTLNDSQIRRGETLIKILVFCLLHIIIVVFFNAPAYAQPQDDEVITPNRLRQPLRTIPQSITIITKEEIRRQHAVTLEEVLRNVPGVQVVGSGTIGEETNVRIRGSEFNQVLILVDGMEINSPFNQEVDLGDILVDNVERIEIVRGPQSASYGSEALGGVINIITRKGGDDPRIKLFAMGGNWRTAYEGVEASGSAHNVNFALSATRLDTDGQFDRDRFFVSAFSARLGFSYKDILDVDFLSRYRDSEDEVALSAALDFSSPNPIVIVFDPNRDFKSRASTNAIRLKHNLAPWWSYSINAAFYSINTDDENPSDPGSPFTTLTDFIDADSNRLNVEMQHDWSLPYIKNFSFGLEVEREQLNFLEFGDTESFGLGPPVTTVVKEARDNLALWWQWVFDWREQLFLSGGVRFDDNADFGQVWTPRASVAYIIYATQTKFRGNFGQGFRAPSFTELHLPGFGNQKLDAEENISYDVGFVQNLFKDRLVFEGTYFWSEYEQLISQDPVTFKFFNLGEAIIQGVEVALWFQPFLRLGHWEICQRNCLLSFNYTYLNTKDKGTGEELLRRPRNTWNAALVYSFLEALDFRVDANFRSSTREEVVLTDAGGRFRIGRTPGSVVLDAAVTYHLVRNSPWASDLQLVGKVNNVLDEDGVEELAGFPMPGINFLVGIEWLY